MSEADLCDICCRPKARHIGRDLQCPETVYFRSMPAHTVDATDGEREACPKCRGSRTVPDNIDPFDYPECRPCPECTDGTWADASLSRQPAAEAEEVGTGLAGDLSDAIDHCNHTEAHDAGMMGALSDLGELVLENAPTILTALNRADNAEATPPVAALLERLREYAKDWRDRAADQSIVTEAADALAAKDAEIAALTAAEPFIRAEQWQDIATAPRDAGVYFMAWGPHLPPGLVMPYEASRFHAALTYPEHLSSRGFTHWRFVETPAIRALPAKGDGAGEG